MLARLTFLAIIGFWLTMNGLLWHADFGVHGGDTPVPVELVWQKILTAPDASSLSVYQAGKRMGYCEISTGVGQQMATFDDEKASPEGLALAGFQLHLVGNAALGDFTNRVKFDGRLQLISPREWRELNLKIATHTVGVELHSLATNQTVHVKITGDGVALEHDLAFADLQNPGAILRLFLGNLADSLPGFLDLPGLAPAAGASNLRRGREHARRNFERGSARRHHRAY